MKRCCLACSIGQRCLKLTNPRKKVEEVEEQPEDLGLPPPLQNLPPIPPSETDSNSEEEGATSNFTPITARTQSKTQRAVLLLAPLREVVWAGGPARLKVPFSTADLDAWKEVAKGYQDDPIKVAKQFELIVKNQDPDWSDIDLILGEMTEIKPIGIKNRSNPCTGPDPWRNFTGERR